jgi:hypothetical protein
MDRTATLDALDHIVAPGGSIAFFHDTHPDIVENRWFRVLCRVCDRYGRNGPEHDGAHKTGGHRRYEPYLFASAFICLDGLSVTIRKAITADDIVGRGFTLSATSPEKLGARAVDFEADLRAALKDVSADGNFTEIAEIVALIARRPS